MRKFLCGVGSLAAPCLGLLAFTACMVLTPVTVMAAETPTIEELWRVIEQQQQQINVLRERSGAGQTAAPAPADMQSLRKQVETLESRADKAEKNLEAATSVIEENAQELASGGILDNTTIGGYGELHYNGGDTDKIDFHRFVLFFGHRFNDWITFASEFELEHAIAGDGKVGEVELEQAYIDFALTDDTNAKAGVILVPVGILNETHEPPTFFGTERNPVEKNILPATWWEAGGMLSNRWDYGLSTDVFLSSGLKVKTTGGDAFKPRKGRGKVGKQTARNPAVTARVKWSGMPGVTLSAAVHHQNDIAQGGKWIRDGYTRGGDNKAWLTNVNADILRDGWGLRALYARWDIVGKNAKKLGRDVQYGWYVEPSYRFDVGKYGELGFFGRYSAYDNNAGDDSPGDTKGGTKTKTTQYDFGLNYWPHPDVVMKADWQIEKKPLAASGKAGDSRLNLGLGYQF